MVFKPGDRIEAKVLRIATDQRVLMEFGRFRALAHIDHSVKPGQTLVLKVLDSGSPVHMQIMADEVVADRPLMPQINLAHALSMAEKRELGQLLNRFIDSKALVSSPLDRQHLRQALVGLRDLNTPLSLDLSLKEVATHLQSAIEDCGLFFEKKLAQWFLNPSKDAFATLSGDSAGAHAKMESNNAGYPGVVGRMPDGPTPWDRLLETQDLKARLILIKTFLDQLDPADAKTLAIKDKEVAFLQKAVGRLLGHLEQQQERLIQRNPQSHLFQVIAHWLPVKDQSQPLKLKLYYPKKEKPKGLDTPQYVCLLLEMDRLGPIRADLKLTGRQLHLTFSVLTQGIRQAFESALDNIMPVLEALFDRVEALVQVSVEKIARFDEEQMVALEPGRIDIQT